MGMSALPSPAIKPLWKPQRQQLVALQAPVPEIFFGGARGGGKSDWLIAEAFRHCAKYEDVARAILFRRSYPELEEIEKRCLELYLRTGAKWHSQKRTWLFPAGGTLKLRFLENIKDAGNYQGHQYTLIGFDELTRWATMEPVDMIRACLRSAVPDIHKRFLLTGNPGGPGHNAVKLRYIDPAPPMRLFDIKDRSGRVLNQAMYIPSRLKDNPALTRADPTYANRLRMVGSPELVRAWLEGDWDIVAGGMFDDVWNNNVHIIEPFEIPPSWRIERSFDWGSSKPFSIGWWAIADGTIANKRRYPRGTLFRIAEWYGWNGRPNEGLRMLPDQIADGILQREKANGWRVNPGPADPSIYDHSTGISVGTQMENRGVYWTRGIASPGSRVTRWQILRKRLRASLQQPMEEPGIFLFSNCHHGAIRTLPIASRDDKNQDDIDTHQEDHTLDEIGYMVMSLENQTVTLNVVGI